MGQKPQHTIPEYDLFVSYSPADREWVEGYLLDALNAAKVRGLSELNFDLGAPRIAGFERAIKNSKRTLLVLSPAYMAEGALQFVDVMVQNYGLESGAWPVIPLLLKPVDLPPRLAFLVPLDATEPQNWADAIARLCSTLQAGPPAPAAKPLCPYPGMRAFREQETTHFYGREAEVEELVQRLRRHPFVAVIGPSGSGKSSLVNAGLVPALRCFCQMKTGSPALFVKVVQLDDSAVLVSEQATDYGQSQRTWRHFKPTSRCPQKSFTKSAGEPDSVYQKHRVHAHLLALASAPQLDHSLQRLLHVFGGELARAADVGPQRHDLVQELGVRVVGEPLAHGAHRDFAASLATLSAMGRPPSPSGVEVGS